MAETENQLRDNTNGSTLDVLSSFMGLKSWNKTINPDVTKSVWQHSEQV